MALRLTASEPAGQGVARSARHEVERALRHLGDERRSRAPGAGELEAVHEVRKRFKKVRAALRLLREEVGVDTYRKENWCFRDAARPLAEVRDADMLVEAWDGLRRAFVDRIEPRTASGIEEALRANRQAVARRVLDEERALAAVEVIATRALARLSEWRIDGDGWASLESGLGRVYRAGRRALKLAEERRSVEALHEWRKQVKYLWHQHQLLDPLRANGAAERADRLHHLSRLLGEDHDLAVLRRTLAADPRTFGGHAALKSVLALVDRRRQDLEQQAFALGRQLYEEPPRVFVGRSGRERSPSPS